MPYYRLLSIIYIFVVQKYIPVLCIKIFANYLICLKKYCLQNKCSANLNFQNICLPISINTVRGRALLHLPANKCSISISAAQHHTAADRSCLLEEGRVGWVAMSSMHRLLNPPNSGLMLFCYLACKNFI